MRCDFGNDVTINVDYNVILFCKLAFYILMYYDVKLRFSSLAGVYSLGEGNS
jgi:hypothetical protein